MGTGLTEAKFFAKSQTATELFTVTIHSHNRLLLTGAAGGLGQALRTRLKANCTVLRLSDRQELGAVGAGEEVLLAELADSAAVSAMVQGTDAIVHMGGVSVEGPFGPILQANIWGMYNLYEAARLNGVKRIVFASSNQVTSFASFQRADSSSECSGKEG